MMSPMLRMWLRIHNGQIVDVQDLPIIVIKDSKVLKEDSLGVLLESGAYLLKEATSAGLPGSLYGKLLKEDTFGIVLEDGSGFIMSEGGTGTITSPLEENITGATLIDHNGNILVETIG